MTRDQMASLRRVAPFTGARIETPCADDGRRSCRSPLHGGADRNALTSARTGSSVAPFTGARIETSRAMASPAVRIVAPFTGARIETPFWAMAPAGRSVAPFTGARIETSHTRLVPEHRGRPFTGARIETVGRASRARRRSPLHGGADRNIEPVMCELRGSIANSPIAATSGLPPGCAMPDCASRLASRTFITGPHAASTALCSTSSPIASGSTRTTI